MPGQGVQVAYVQEGAMPKMKAAVFVEPERIVLGPKSILGVGLLDARLRVTATTICETDIPILRGEYRVSKGCFTRDRIDAAHDLFANQRDGVLNVAGSV